MADKLLSATYVMIEVVYVGKMKLSRDRDLISRRRRHHFRTELVLKLGQRRSEVLKPVFCKIIKSEIGLIWASPDDVSAFVLMSFGMAFFEVYTSLTTFVAEHAGPKGRTEVLKRGITMVQILFLQYLFRWPCENGVSAKGFTGQVKLRASKYVIERITYLSNFVGHSRAVYKKKP
jgi:hypothetical protein